MKVTDPLSPNCNRTSATIAALASMPPGAIVSYSCTRPNVKTGFTNVATANGTPPTGANVSATDTAPVTVKVQVAFTPPSTPAIGIVKSPKRQTLTTKVVTTKTMTTTSYGTAHFTIKVTNKGSVRLTAVKVADALSPNCNRSLGTLAPSASRTYTCINASVTRNFTNIAIASGVPPKGPKVTATDHALVKVKSTTASTQPAKFTG